MAKMYQLYALVIMRSNNKVQSVNNSYYTDNMARAQALFKSDLRNRGMVPISIVSEAQIQKKIQSMK